MSSSHASDSTVNSTEDRKSSCKYSIGDVVRREIIHRWTIAVPDVGSVQGVATVWDGIFHQSHDASNSYSPQLETPVFNAEGQQWRLILRRCGKKFQTLNSIEVEIDLQSEDTTNLWIVYRILVFDGDGTTAVATNIQRSSSWLIENVSLRIRWKPKFQFSIRDANGAVLELKTGKLMLVTKIILLEGAGDVWHKIKVPSYTLRNDLKAEIDFKEGMKGEDVTIITAATADGDDGEEEDEQEKEPCKFSAHKFILAARSPVFAKMFEHEEMSENKLNEVWIEDIEPDVLEEMLKFVYTGEVTRLQELAIPLLYASEKYELKRLKALCERQLAIDIKVENAANLLVVSSQCNAQQLKEVVLKFVAFNGQEVMKTEEWENVEKAGLDKEVLRTIFYNPEVGPPTKKAKLS